MATRYKSAFASASGFCSANAARRPASAPAISSSLPSVPEAAQKAAVTAKTSTRLVLRHAKRAA